MNIIKLTSIGFTRNFEKNFSDDGNYFWAYKYGDLDYTYLKDTKDKMLFLAYHPTREVSEKLEKNKELSDKVFTLGNKFNGVNYESLTKNEIVEVAKELSELVSNL